jgi:hypothetical protein
MTAFAIVTGSLFRAPEQRTSKAGKPYVTATIRAKDGDALQWWRVTAFSESAQAELMRLGEGAPGGTPPKISLSIIADHVLALRQPPKERKASKERKAPYRGGAAAFDDAIPFGAQ